MATTVKITETYDMKTTVNKLGVVSVHTPSVTLLKKLYPGLLKNHRFVRFVKCDVAGACASVLPADPLQVGVSSGQIAPEDMFNPILYTAVTNSSYDTLVARINQLSDVVTLNSVADGKMIDGIDADNVFKVYYALLSENGKYRKAMPQSGFSIKGLVPLAHTILSTFGNFGGQGNNYALSEDGETPIQVPSMDVPDINESWTPDLDGTHAILYRGKAVKMPKFPIHSGQEGTTADIPTPNIPKTNVLALILPPGKLNEFYYRMRVTWTVRFENVCSTLEAGGYGAYLEVGGYAHGSNYTFAASKSTMDVNEDMVDANGVEVEKIMES